MISEFENLSLGGTNATSNHGDPFPHTGNLSGFSSVYVDLRTSLVVFQLKFDLNALD